MRLHLNGRECEAWAEHGLDEVDSHFAGGYWTDTEENLTDDELDLLTAENPEALSELWFDVQVVNADDWMDAWRDGTHDNVQGD